MGRRQFITLFAFVFLQVACSNNEVRKVESIALSKGELLIEYNKSNIQGLVYMEIFDSDWHRVAKINRTEISISKSVISVPLFKIKKEKYEDSVVFQDIYSNRYYSIVIYFQGREQDNIKVFLGNPALEKSIDIFTEPIREYVKLFIVDDGN